MSENPKLCGLQSLRGIAAFAVLFQHVTFYSTNAKGIDYLPFLRIDFGRFGVGLFFVISGFVMAGCLSQGRRFLLNRVVRIYPGFWLSVLASCLLLSSPSFGWTFDWASLFLVPSVLNNSYRVPYWTLIYEMAFYVATYAIIITGASRATVAKAYVAWLVAVIVVTKYNTIPLFEPGSWVLLSRMNVYFIFGMLMGLHSAEVAKVPSMIIAVGAVVLWCIGDSLAAIAPLPADLMLALAFCGVVLFGVRHLKVAALEKIGDASFGIYLLHVPIAVLAIHFVSEHVPTVGLFELWLSTMAVAFGGSLVFGLLETKMHTWLKRTFQTRKIDRVVHGSTVDGRL